MLHKIPKGDVLIHAGDLMNSGYNAVDISIFLDWFGSFKHQHKIFIAGNHDRYFETFPDYVLDMINKKNKTLKKKITYLQDEEIIIDGVKFYGSPWQPEFFDWAFNLKKGEPLKKIWSKIPVNTEILVTHGPPHGILDIVLRKKEHVGCEMLKKRIAVVKPKMHLFGHIHESYGVERKNGTTFANASICNAKYAPINKPLVFDYIGGKVTEV
jgi:Icc-related predicted phosphoesterase